MSPLRVLGKRLAPEARPGFSIHRVSAHEVADRVTT
jgi:hypothetical protein